MLETGVAEFPGARLCDEATRAGRYRGTGLQPGILLNVCVMIRPNYDRTSQHRLARFAERACSNGQRKCSRQQYESTDQHAKHNSKRNYPASNQRTTVAEINEYIPETRTAFRSISGPVPCHGFREFQKTADGTNFTYAITLEPRGVVLLLKPVLRAMFQKQVGDDVCRLKAKLEQASTQRLPNNVGKV